MSKRAIVPEGWSGPDRPPYSPAMRVGELVFVSGQLPLDPASGEMVGGSIQAQTTRVLQNIQAVLEQAGGTLDDLVKVTVYLLRRSDWAAMNEAYREHVGAVPPARCAVVVPEMAPGAAVEIEAIAVVGG
jgi:2-iminobutanoate/2-iminopropanoate deaminase